MQAGVHECGRLPRARRADDHVPGEIVEAVTTAPLLLEGRDRFFKPLPQLHGVGAWRAGIGTCLRDYGRHELVAGPIRPESLEQHRRDPQCEHKADGNQSRRRGFERTILGECEIRPRVPDKQREESQTQQGHKRAALQKGQHMAVMSWSTHVDDFDASIARAVLRF